MSTDAASYSTDDAELLEHIVASAEARLEAQLTTSLAADQRALILAGFLAAAIAGLVGAGVTSIQAPQTANWIGWIAIASAAPLLVALALATWSARPVTWFFPGTCPESWLGNIERGTPRVSRLREHAADLQDKIERNGAVMQRNSRYLMAALALSYGTLIVATSAFALSLPPPWR